MSIIGEPADWADLIDSLVPKILGLVIATWEAIAPPASDAREDPITVDLCRALQRNRDARELPFQIDTQQVELKPAAGEDVGRLDISFRPPISREDIYICLECKRLNVLENGRIRPYASEYVNFGMMRFVSGQYASKVRHGGILAYVLDGNTVRAVENVSRNLRAKHAVLGMEAPAEFAPSKIIRDDARVKETRHRRQGFGAIDLHHMFMAVGSSPPGASATATAPSKASPRKTRPMPRRKRK